MSVRVLENVQHKRCNFQCCCCMGWSSSDKF
jgi:inosine/xanthosine triphosphate pyrophosphatase family protein